MTWLALWVAAATCTIEPIYHVCEDTLSFNFLIRKNFEVKMNVHNRLDFQSMSSNFSTNIPNMIMPGVRGRNFRGKNLHMKDYQFNPLSVNSRDGQIMILEQSRNQAYNLRGNSEGEFQMIDTVLNTIFETSPGMQCSNQAVYKVFWVLICFDMLKRLDVKEDVMYLYTLIMIDSSKNSVEFIGTFKNYYYQNPYIHFNFAEKKDDSNMMVFLYNRIPEERRKSRFVTNSRLTVIHLWRVGDGFKMKDIVFKDVENLLFHTISDSVSLRNFFFINQQHCNIFFRKKNADYSISNKIFTCRIDFDTADLNTFGFSECVDFTEKNVLNFRSHKYNSVHIDDDKNMFFCQFDKGVTAKDCRRGQMNLEWNIMYMEVLKNVCVVIVQHFKRKYVFIYYFEQKVFTWFYSVGANNHLRALVSRGQNDEVYLLIFIRRGFKTFDLTFEPTMKITSDHVESTEDKILYLEGHPIYRMQIWTWDGESVVNYFTDKWWPVIIRGDSKTYFDRLGFRGNNLNFQNNALQKIYFFKQVAFRPDDLDQLGIYYNTFGDKKLFKLYANTRQDLIFIFRDKAMVTKFHYDEKRNINSLRNQREVRYPDDFEMPIESIVKIDKRPYKILVLLRNPYRLVTLNIASLTVFEYSLPFDLNKKDIRDCTIHEFVLVCIKKYPQVSIESPKYFVITPDFVKELENVNIFLKEQFLGLKEKERDGKLPTLLEIKELTTDPFIKLRGRVVVELTYQGTIGILGFSYDVVKTENLSMDSNNNFIVRNFEALSYLEDNPVVTKYSKLFLFGNEWVSLSTHPTYSFISFNKISQIEYEYLDTNKILFLKVSVTYRLATIVYESLEDNQIYFAVYEITPFVERQMVRNQRFTEYSEDLDISYVVISPVIVYIVFYNQSTCEFHNSYTYFFNGPYIIAKSLHNIIIDDKRFALQLYVDKEMHWSFYKSLQEPAVYVDPEQDVGSVTFKVKDYFDIIGHVHTLSPLDPDDNDGFPSEDFKIYEPLDFQYNKPILQDVTIHDYVERALYAENRIYYTLNAVSQNTFSIFR